MSNSEPSDICGSASQKGITAPCHSTYHVSQHLARRVKVRYDCCGIVLKKQFYLEKLEKLTLFAVLNAFLATHTLEAPRRYTEAIR